MAVIHIAFLITKTHGIYLGWEDKVSIATIATNNKSGKSIMSWESDAVFY